MQEVSSANIQTQVPATGTGAGHNPPGQVESGDLDQQIQELDKQIKDIQAQIADKQGKLQSAETELEKYRTQQKALEATRNGLKSVVDSSKGDRQKVAQQREAAVGEGEDAYQELQQIKQDLEDQLADDYTDKVNQAIQQVDQQTDKLRGDVQSKQQELAQAEEELAAQKDAAAKAQAALKQAQTGLRGLPPQIQAAVAQVKKARTALQTAYSRGPARDAYLLAYELSLALDSLGKLLDPKYEQFLVDKVQEAWAAYRDADAGTPKAEDLVKQRKDEMAPLAASLQDYQDNRRKKIEDLLASEQPAPEGAAKTPAEQKGDTQTPATQDAAPATTFTPATQS